MRQRIVAGNWKMNNNLEEGVSLANALAKSELPSDVLVVLGTPFIHLTQVVENVKSTNIGVAAQNCYSEESGAYTGEISAAMIASTGAKYVILGHSERRTYFKESNGDLAKKVKLALAHGLTPIFCIGEVLEERESGALYDVIQSQLQEGLYDLSDEDFSKIILAYEPVWAIGTGKVATPEQAQEMHLFIRNSISDRYGDPISQSTPILYGGSCKPSNAAELFANEDVDGGLIGGASLKAEDFTGIITA